MTGRDATGVALAGVSKLYGRVRAVDDVSFDVAPGTLVTLLGPSGCGKTTTLRLIAGLEMASAGRLAIGGVDVTRLSASERDVGMVFQSYALFPHMSVLENVGYGLEVSKLSATERRERALATLKLVGLDGYDARMPSALSGGQQQRVALARALVIEPGVLLFDEPLSNLDAKLRRRMRDEIRELQTRLGITAVYVTHDQEEAMAVSDRIVVMREGRIAQAGTPAELYEQPADRFVADFLGGANLIACEVVAVADGIAEVRLAGLALRLPARGVSPGPATLVARYGAARPGAEGLEARVRKATWLGGHVEYSFDTPVGELFVVASDREPRLGTGATTRLAFGPSGLSLVA
ncbi:MAG: ABC transporter ATP-binding protein [Alphaproteobacteria bacterium]|nr:ABC transporter ATP-binding protein [Alphaproteobacteria bacterium]